MAIDLFVKVQLQRSLPNYTKGDTNVGKEWSPDISKVLYRHFSNV